ncbi:MAG: hypothetical protein LBH75_00960 [Treponema sp.]|nr:hypothetical protein [Treponema sp.]
MKKTSLFMVTVMLSFGVMLTGCDNSDSGGGKTDAETPVFSVQPQGATYGDGADADPMTVTASVTDGGTLTYQWYRSTTDNTTGGTTISGATKSAYTPSLAEIGTVYYYVVVINTNNSASGVKVKTASSDITVVTVMGGAESRATLRYQTVPLQTDDGNTYSLISSAKGRYGYMTGIEGRTEYNLWRYEYYIYLLGHIERVPIVYGDAFEYNGRTPITVSYEKSHCTEESVMESTTVSLERSVTNTATIG